jgi:hypothetical protein
MHIETDEEISMSEDQSPPRQETSSLLDSVNEGVRQGAADAAAASGDSAGVSEVMGRVVYKGFYVTSYCLTYSALTLARWLPLDNLAGQGLHDGAAAAREKVRAQECPDIAEALSDPVAEDGETTIPA